MATIAGIPPGHRRAEFQAAAHLPGQLQQLRPAFGDQKLIGRDHGLAGAQGAAKSNRRRDRSRRSSSTTTSTSEERTVSMLSVQRMEAGSAVDFFPCDVCDCRCASGEQRGPSLARG